MYSHTNKGIYTNKEEVGEQHIALQHSLIQYKLYSNIKSPVYNSYCNPTTQAHRIVMQLYLDYSYHVTG